MLLLLLLFDVATRIYETLFHSEIIVQNHLVVFARLIGNIPFIGKFQKPVYDFALARVDEINIFGDNMVENGLILVSFPDELVAEDGLELLTHKLQLVDLKLWRDMDYRIKRLVHVLRRTLRCNVIDPTLDLVTHRRRHIIAGNLPLVIDDRFAPGYGACLVGGRKRFAV